MKVLKRKPGENWELIDIECARDAIKKEVGGKYEIYHYVISAIIVCKRRDFEPIIGKIMNGTFEDTVLVIDPNWGDITDEAVKLFAPELLEEYTTGKPEFDKEEFMRSKLGREMRSIIRNWDRVLKVADEELLPPIRKKYDELLANYSVQWHLIQLALEEFYSVDCNFVRTRDYAGVMMNDGEWLYRIDRTNSEPEEER